MCNVTITRSGRALCVTGGAQLPRPLQVTPQPPVLGQQGARLPNNTAPGAFGFFRALSDQPGGVAAMVAPRTFFRNGVPADGAMIPVSAPFLDNVSPQFVHQLSVGHGELASKVVQWMVVNPANGQCWANQGQPGHPWAARGYPVPLSHLMTFITVCGVTPD